MNNNQISIDALVKAVRKYAIDHYEEDGWDYLIECHEDTEVRAILAADTLPTGTHPDGNLTLEDAISLVQSELGLKIKDSVRRDIQGEIF